jgi:hypothetical protein
LPALPAPAGWIESGIPPVLNFPGFLFKVNSLCRELPTISCKVDFLLAFIQKRTIKQKINQSAASSRPLPPEHRWRRKAGRPGRGCPAHQVRAYLLRSHELRHP